MAWANPWYGYKRIAVMCRRAGQAVRNREAYRVMKAHGLLHRRLPREAELYQAAKLYELLPSGPNELWQMDVTYVHIPGFGWWYAVTVIDYSSRYLLAAHLTSSYCAGEVVLALEQARAEAERLCGPLAKRPFLVTDNGSSFIAKRFAAYAADRYAHVRIRYRTPTQLVAGAVSPDVQGGGDLLAAVREPGARAGVYCGVQTSIQRDTPALGPDPGGRRGSGDAAGRIRERVGDRDSAMAGLGEGCQEAVG